MDTLRVRLKEHAPARGYVLHTYTIRGVRFVAGGPFRHVPAALGDYLRTVRSALRDPRSPLAFEVCSGELATAPVETHAETTNVPATRAVPVEPLAASAIAAAKPSAPSNDEQLAPPIADGPIHDGAGPEENAARSSSRRRRAASTTFTPARHTRFQTDRLPSPRRAPVVGARARAPPQRRGPSVG